MPINNRKKSGFQTKLRDYLNKGSLIVTLVILFSLVSNVAKVSQSKSRITKTQKEVDDLEAENSKLREKLDYIKSDAFREEQLRDSLGLAREGEVVVVLPDDDVLRKLAPKKQIEEVKLPDPNWKKWLDLFR